MPHQWQKRASHQRCDSCHESLTGTEAYLCLYCQREVHGVCRSWTPLTCDLGTFQDAMMAVRGVV